MTLSPTCSAESEIEGWNRDKGGKEVETEEKRGGERKRQEQTEKTETADDGKADVVKKDDRNEVTVSSLGSEGKDDSVVAELEQSHVLSRGTGPLIPISQSRRGCWEQARPWERPCRGPERWRGKRRKCTEKGQIKEEEKQGSSTGCVFALIPSFALTEGGCCVLITMSNTVKSEMKGMGSEAIESPGLFDLG
ncbi:hypothetical protein PAMA_015347 [Pampus argenteus]